MNAGRIPSLDGVRAISIILVIFSHLAKWHHIFPQLPDAYGSLGVHMFFVLSGYLITSLLLQEHEKSSTIVLKRFYLRRALRILPAALVFLAVAIALYWKQMHWLHIVAALFYFANLDTSRPWIFGHLWSLSIEEQFYLIWPFAIRKWYRHRTAVLLSVCLLTPLFRAMLYAFKARGGIVGSLPVFADQLAVGCLLAVFLHRLPKIGKLAAWAMLLIAVLSPLFPATSPAKTLFMLFAIRPLLDFSLAGLLLHVMQHPYKFLNWPAVAWLGRISYSLYLWQELFCSNSAFHLGYTLVLPALGCACLSYYFVEKPVLRIRDNLLKNLLSPRHTIFALEIKDRDATMCA